MTRHFLALLAIATLASCSSSPAHRSFKPEALLSQIFTISASKDTLLRTKNGALIKIPAGALQGESESVQLEVREAYHIGEIVKAGLLTTSNGRLLSSGGMIYINAVGENTVRITRELQVSIPASYVNKDMQLFKGEIDNAGNLNWTNPSPLNQNDAMGAIQAGRRLFNANCASCHAIAKDMAGPALAHISKMREKQWLYDFTRNSARLISDDELAWCIFTRWNKTPMPAYPDLTTQDLDNLYGYIQHISDSANLPLPRTMTRECLDSCNRYATLLRMVRTKLDSLTESNGNAVEEVRIDNAEDEPSTDTSVPSASLPAVSPVYHPAIMYKFTIESFGWYNVDLLLKPGRGMTKSNLVVRIQGQYRERLNIYLVLPSIKSFGAAGQKPGGTDEYVFTSPDGSIWLPENSKGYIIAVGDREDDIVFAQTEFLVSEDHQFSLTPQIITQEQFNLRMQKLNFDQLKISADKVENAEEIKQSIKEMKDVEKLKPRNCDCQCLGEEGVYRLGNDSASIR